MSALLNQFVAFSAVGVLAAVGHYGLYVALVEAGVAGPVPASAAGFILGGIISYLLNYHFTFRSVRRHREATVRFVTVALVGLLLNTLLVGLLTGPGALHYLAAQVIATGCVLTWTFLGNRLWTFAHPGTQPDQMADGRRSPMKLWRNR